MSKSFKRKSTNRDSTVMEDVEGGMHMICDLRYLSEFIPAKSPAFAVVVFRADTFEPFTFINGAILIIFLCHISNGLNG
jgi:hypothetical protein